MSESPSQISPEEEIKILEQQLEQKKHALEAQQPEVGKTEKDVLHDVLHENMEAIQNPQDDSQKKTSILAPTAQQTVMANSTAKDLQETDHQQQIHALVEIAISKGLVDAVETARHMGNPHLLDDFHDAVVDSYYQKILEHRGIAQ